VCQEQELETKYLKEIARMKICNVVVT